MSSLPCESVSFFSRGVYCALMPFSTSFMCSLRAFSFGKVSMYSYVSSTARFTSFAIGSTFFTLATRRLYALRWRSFLNSIGPKT